MFQCLGLNKLFMNRTNLKGCYGDVTLAPLIKISCLTRFSLRSFFPGLPFFLPPQKPKTSIFQFDLDKVGKEPL